jgi:hypothetical protein
MQCQRLMKACNDYRADPASGNRYPSDLSQLLNPTFASNKAPYVDGGKQALIDPWGSLYRFEIVKDPNGTGDEIPVVFTTDPQGRKIAWPREYDDV